MQSFPIQIQTDRFDRAVRDLHAFYQVEIGTKFPRTIVEKELKDCLERHVESYVEDFSEHLTSPHKIETQEFQRNLELAVERHVAKANGSVPALVPEEERISVYSGSRTYSAERLTAMVSYLVRSGIRLYKTNLNKLLFYADMTFFSHYHRGISGTTYLKFEYGPVPYRFDQFLDQLEKERIIQTKAAPEHGINARVIKSGLKAPSEIQILSDAEIRVLEWVVREYGDMTPTQISDLSHEEAAYLESRDDKPISYTLSKSLKNLPPDGFWPAP